MRSLSELSARNKCVEITRWVLVVPAAWAAAMTLPIVARFLRPPAMTQPPGAPQLPVSEFQRILITILLGIATAAEFVLIGAKFAPRWRLPVGGILGVVWTGFAYLIHVGPLVSFELRNLTHFMAAAVGAVAAAAYVWWSDRDKRRQTDTASERG